MVNEILDFLQIQPGQTGLDATLGYGGHTGHMLEQLKGQGHMWALDVDTIEMEKTRKRLMFLILFLKFPRVGTLVADTAFVRNGGFTLYTGLLYTCHLYAILPYTQILLCL